MITVVARHRFSYFEVVRIEPRPGAPAELAALRGRVGAVLGWSTDGGGAWPRAYVVDVDGLNESWWIETDDLAATGQMRRREDYYDGSSLRVSPAGEVLGYPGTRRRGGR